MEQNLDPKRFLEPGGQTQLTDSIKDTARQFRANDLDLILKILAWIQKNIKEDSSPEIKNRLFRKRTAGEIIESKLATGCTDYALAFIALARAKGVPTKYIEAIRNKWLDIGDENFIEGHVFAECFINGKWHIIDPQEGTIKVSHQRFKIFKEGLDSWDIGIKSFSDLKKKFMEFKNDYIKNHPKTRH